MNSGWGRRAWEPSPAWEPRHASPKLRFRKELAIAWRCAEVRDAHGIGDSESRRASQALFPDVMPWLALWCAIVDPKERAASFYIEHLLSSVDSTQERHKRYGQDYQRKLRKAVKLKGQTCGDRLTQVA